MSSLSDRELLERYARGGEDEAFTTLGRRYQRLVYSVCLRELGQADLAADATQETFLLLARSAGMLSRKSRGSLAGWLFTAARNTARNTRRAEQRRQHYEKGAGMDEAKARDQESRQLWEALEPRLNDALEQLKPPEREALLLRYFEQQSLQELGQRLGVSENAAQMRVSRALERLRSALVRHGIVLTVALLTLLLEQNASIAAPPEVAERLAGIAQQGRALPPAPPHPVRLSRVLVLVAVVMGVGLAGGLALWQRLPPPERPQVDTQRLGELGAFFEGVWKGTETGKQNNRMPLTAIFQFSPDRQRLTYRYVYSGSREPEEGWLTVEKRTGRVVLEGRDVFSLAREDETLVLKGWERRNTGNDVLWNRAQQRWRRQGNRLTAVFERGDLLQVERTLELRR